VRERPRIGAVVARGAVRLAGELGAEPGLLYEPDRLQQRAADLERSLIDAGHRRARVTLSGRSRGDRVDLCVEVVPGLRALVDRVEFIGNSRLSAELLQKELHTDDGRINAPGGVYRPDALERDLLLLAAAYYDRGMLDAEIEPRVVETARSIEIAIEIKEGPVYRIGKLELRGKLAGPSARYRELLGVKSGEVFSRQRFVEGIARIVEQSRGKLEVEPQTTLHPERGVVDVVLELKRR
jgi:outer membrane protein insertion porin family